MRVVELAQSCKPAFARHETFHPRFGWLRKAYEGALISPELFAQADATVSLGVGKNMVSAIRYWGLAFKVLDRAEDPDRPRRPGVAPSALATTLFSDDGWDPYLEEPASLWLLHWQLLSAPCLAPSWWVTFHLFSSVQFDDSTLSEVITEAGAAVDGWSSVVPASIKKDVDCLIRTYGPRRSGHQGLDDLLDCPFRELGLIEPVSRDARSYRFNIGPKPGLADEIVAYAALDYMGVASPGAGAISVARLATDVGAPGRAFRLSESEIFDALRRVADGVPGIKVAEPAGLRQLYVDGNPLVAGRGILATYYKGRTGSLRTWETTHAQRVASLEAELAGLEDAGREDVMQKLNARDRVLAVRKELASLGSGL